MSAETSNWLNTMTLIGATEKRGNAWHYRAEDQGDESNHYPGFIPVADVERRLFDWTPLEGDITVTVVNENGVLTMTDSHRKAIIRPPGALSADDPGSIFMIPTKGWVCHPYRTWLLNEVATILDDDLGITSAGLLEKGGVAWVEVSVPDTITTPSGVPFRPNLLAATSYNGSLATRYKRTASNTVCDNTMHVALRSAGGEVRYRHTKNSARKLVDARAALEIVHTIADDFTAQVEELTNVTVSDGDWAKFLDSLIKLPEDDGRARTFALDKRVAYEKLWTRDDRVTPWKNTAWGVVQAVNTYEHHLNRVRGERGERNMLRAVNGEWDKLDVATLDRLNAVTA
jgi:phage/plasmid-like protein (TIGR03299 family)